MGMGWYIFRRKTVRLSLLCCLVLAPGHRLAGQAIGQLPGRSAGSVLESSFRIADHAFRREITTARSFDRGGPATVKQGHAGPAIYGLEIPEHPAIKDYAARYLDQQKEGLKQTLRRAARYRSLIWDALESHNLPRELLVLPVLESSFRVEAVSRSGAVGLWQIMDNTAAPLGLRIDDWIDERRDIFKSTDAALRKLKENRALFGTWPLALAAYNGGTGLILRTIKKTGIRDFWELREKGLLPSETAEYVPKFLALVLICSYPGRFGVHPGWVEQQYWEQLPLKRSVDLELLAEQAELPLSLLEAGNSGLKTRITPPAVNPFWLTVPKGSREQILSVVMDPERVLLRYRYHTIYSGDTFYALARLYRLDLELLLQANPDIEPRFLPLGVLLKIPVVGGSPDEIIDASRPKAAQVDASRPDRPMTDAALLEDFPAEHQIRKGDTLWAISRKYRISPELLAAANNRGLNDVLKIGEFLRVPGPPQTDNDRGANKAFE